MLHGGAAGVIYGHNYAKNLHKYPSVGISGAYNSPGEIWPTKILVELQPSVHQSPRNCVPVLQLQDLFPSLFGHLFIVCHQLGAIFASQPLGSLHVSSVRSPELDGLKLKTWGPEYLTHNNLTNLMEKVWFKQKFFLTCSIKTIGGDMIPMVADDIATVSYPIVVSWDHHS